MKTQRAWWQQWVWAGPALGALAVTLALTGCANPAVRQPVYRGPAARAPVVDRSARRPPGYYATPRSAPTLEVDQRPVDPSLPREYAESAPPYTPDDGYDDGYRSSRVAPGPVEESYDSPPIETETAVSQTPPLVYQQRPTPTEAYQQPGYPPPAMRAEPVDAYPQEAPGAIPEPQPVVPRPPRIVQSAPVAPAPVAPQVASPPPTTVTPQAAPVGAAAVPPVATVAPAASIPQPPPQPTPAAPAPPPQPVELPPAEITREGNQAVTALLDSADQYVKSNQLDKAGAALERALRIEPRNAGIWHDLAQIRLHQRQYQQAESLATKSSSLASDNRALQSRNWKVIAVARRAAGNTLGADEAEVRATQLGQ